jgi:anti-sigma factor RsiW
MTLDPKFVELMHARIDGVIDDHEDRELARYLEQNAEARDHFAQLEALAERLERAEEVAPPPDLRTGVLEAVRALRMTRQLPVPDRIGAQGTGLTVLRYGYALAAGVILGVVGYHWGVTRSGDPALDPSTVSGTMTRPAVAAEPIHEVGLDLGSARIERQQDGFAVVLDLDSIDAVDVGLEFEAREVGFLGFTQDLGEIGSLQVTDRSISWTQRGHHRVAVFLENRGGAPATVELLLSAAEGPIQRATLDLPGPG